MHLIAQNMLLLTHSLLQDKAYIVLYIVLEAISLIQHQCWYSINIPLLGSKTKVRVELQVYSIQFNGFHAPAKSWYDGYFIYCSIYYLCLTI